MSWAPVKGENGNSGICTEKLRLDGKKLCNNAKIEITDSTAPAALVVCPVEDFVEEMGGIFSPNSRTMAVPSLTSLFVVPVPCALI